MCRIGRHRELSAAAMLHTNKALVRGERRAVISRACSGVAGGAGVFAEARDHADLGRDDES